MKHRHGKSFKKNHRLQNKISQKKAHCELLFKIIPGFNPFPAKLSYFNSQPLFIFVYFETKTFANRDA